MKRRPSFWYNRRATQWYAYHRRLRRRPEEAAWAAALSRELGAALHDPTEGIRSLSRVGVSFSVLSRWTRWRIRFWRWTGHTQRAQRIILTNLKRELG